MSTASDDPLVGQDIAGYRVVATLGEGGMGRVYRAILPSIGAQVAIKVLSRELVGDAEMAERFVAEARVANLVRHDGLVNVIGLGLLADGRPYQIMELLTGEPLAAIISRQGALPLGSLCELLCEALAALAPMHARGIVHRDLKPSNLFVTTGGRLKIIDFGIAKLTTQLGITRTGQTIGTPEYMAPEQVEGDDVDARTDLYALGVVLFEGATGVRPFAGRVLEALATHPDPPSAVERLPGAPAALDTAIQTAMAPDRRRRFADAAAMERALRELIEALPPAAFAPLVEASPAPAESPVSSSSASSAVSSTAPTAIERRTPPREPPTAKLPIERLDKYEVRGVIGQGGAGVVMIGFDPAVSRRVALKILHDSSGPRRDRLVGEARAMARVGHPNVVTLYELGEDAGRLFLVMELVEGTDVAGWLRDRKRTWREITDVFLAAGRGLAAAHAVGVIHRDFKPSNVLLGADGRPRVSDFGLAPAGDGAVGGTAAYMAPEQLEGAPAEPTSDQFAFCASMWEALHGELPFAGTSAVAIATAARAGKLRSPASTDVPAAINAALQRGLASDPRDRFPAMAELLAAIERAIAPPSKAWRPWVIAGLVVAAAVTVAIVAVGAHDPPTTPPVAPPAPPATTLADVRTARSPTEVLAALARLSPQDLATDEARTLATRAAASGPVRTVQLDAAITSLRFSRDMNRLGIGTDRGVTILDLEGPGVVRTVAPPSSPLALELDDHAVLALVADGLVELPLASSGGAPRYRFQCPPVTSTAQAVPFPVRTAIGASPGFRYLACPTAAGAAIYRPGLASTAHVLDAGGLATFSSDNTRVVTRDLTSASLIVNDLATGAEIGRRHQPSATSVADNGDVIAIADGGSVTRWDPRTGTERTFASDIEIDQLILLDGRDASLIATERSGKILMFGPAGDQVGGWEIGSALNRIVLPEHEPTRIIIATAADVRLRDLVRSRHLQLDQPADQIAVSPDGLTIAVAHGSTVSLWFDLDPPHSLPYVPQPFPLSRTSRDGRWFGRRVPGVGLSLTDIATGDDVTVPDSEDAQALDFTDDGTAIAFATSDGRVLTWTRGATVAPRVLGRATATVNAVFAMDPEHAVVTDKAGHLWLATAGTITAACGDRTLLSARPPLVVVRGGDTISTCDVGTGAGRTLLVSNRPIGASISEDRAHILLVHDDGAVSLFRAADGVVESTATVLDAEDARLDAAGDRAIVRTTGGVVVVERDQPRAIVLETGPTDARIAQIAISRDGTRVGAVIGLELVAWDVDRPADRRVVGTIALGSTYDLELSDRRTVLLTGPSMLGWTSGAPTYGYVLNDWPDGPAELADVQGWIRRIARQ